MSIHTQPELRHDFVFLFDITDGNPNGDPDGGNLPRTDPETMQGLVTDVCLKRKIRNYVDFKCGDDETTKIYIQDQGVALNDMNDRAYKALGMKSTGTKQKRADVSKVRDWMCQNFYDIRMFGAVMTTGVNCGQVRGPIQLTFARSVDPVMPLDIAITRIAITKPEDAAVVVGDDDKEGGKGKITEFGSKALIPYGLYVARGFYSPAFAQQTGVKPSDLELFWEALVNMWEFDRSASRGMMAPRGLYVFSHNNKLGRAPAHKLFERIQIHLKDAVAIPRQFADYSVTFDGQEISEDYLESIIDGVTLTRLC